MMCIVFLANFPQTYQQQKRAKSGHQVSLSKMANFFYYYGTLSSYEKGAQRILVIVWLASSQPLDRTITHKYGDEIQISRSKEDAVCGSGLSTDTSVYKHDFQWPSQ